MKEGCGHGAREEEEHLCDTEASLSHSVSRRKKKVLVQHAFFFWSNKHFFRQACVCAHQLPRRRLLVRKLEVILFLALSLYLALAALCRNGSSAEILAARRNQKEKKNLGKPTPNQSTNESSSWRGVV